MALNFYEHENFIGERGMFVRDGDLAIESSFHPPGAHGYIEKFRHRSEQFYFIRHGVLEGEYLCFQGVLFLQRTGEWIKANLSELNVDADERVEQLCSSDYFKENISALIDVWERYPLVENLPVLSDPNIENYYHFSLDLLPRFRFLDLSKIHAIVIPMMLNVRPFQTDLLSRVLGNGKKILFFNDIFRIKNPILVHAHPTQEAIGWLRQTINISTKPGTQSYYIRRPSPSTEKTPHREISLDGGIERVLDEFNFKTVEFTGDQAVHDQVNMLEGAGIVLAVHGANLTNIVYLHPPLVVIEILSSKHTENLYYYISAVLGFRYHAIISDQYDAEGRIIVDSDHLRSILNQYHMKR